MPYSDEHKRFFNTKPVDARLYSTITFKNDIVGSVYLLVADQTGPYVPMMFNSPGEGMKQFIPVRAEVPQVAAQDPMSNDVGTIRLGRVASYMSEYIEQIARAATKFSDKVIEVTLATYNVPIEEPVYSTSVYVGYDGITMNESDVSVKLQFSNPAKSRYAPFYNPEEYIGLQYG